MRLLFTAEDATALASACSISLRFCISARCFTIRTACRSHHSRCAAAFSLRAARRSAFFKTAMKVAEKRSWKASEDSPGAQAILTGLRGMWGS